MRRVLTVLLLALVIVGVFALPALALRDPFDPLVSDEVATTGTTTEGSGTTTTTGGNGTTATDSDGDGVADVVENNGSEAIANTGVEAAPWVLTAVAMIGSGVVMMRVSRHFAPYL